MASELKVDSLTEEEIARILPKIRIDPATTCWTWTGEKIPKGYGTVRFRSRTEYVHRIMFALHRHALPRGRDATKLIQIDHLCKNTSCCNPDHMEIVTRRENILRSGSPTANNARKTHCSRGHMLPQHEEGKQRRCVLCRAITDKAKRDRQLNGPNREAILAKDRDAKRIYRSLHPDKTREVQTKYSEKNREQIKVRAAARRAANRDKINERQRVNRIARLVKQKTSHA